MVSQKKPGRAFNKEIQGILLKGEQNLKFLVGIKYKKGISLG